MLLPDNVILNSLQKDKDVGIQQLFDRYYRSLVLYAEEYVKDQAIAEDLVQELFVKLWEDDYLLKVTDTSLSAYLYSAVRNKCRSYFQKKDVLMNRKELEGIDIPVEMVADIDEERIDRVMKEIELLPERTRQVVECVMLKGMRYKAAAEELDISVNTIKFLLKEGTKRLRDRLTGTRTEILLFFLSKIWRSK